MVEGSIRMSWSQEFTEALALLNKMVERCFNDLNKERANPLANESRLNELRQRFRRYFAIKLVLETLDDDRLRQITEELREALHAEDALATT